MMTKPSSSRRDFNKSGVLIEVTDSSGRVALLDELVGKGGEGSVFAVDGAPTLAAKVYHQTPIAGDNLEKLEAMVGLRSPALDAISAWPQSVLFNSHRGEPIGILMPRIADARHLHELYGTSNRRQHFPDARWQHLVLAARNVAAAFDAIHSSGLVVGDVNQGNLLVDANMCVRFIDCDSFQICANGKTYVCPVGAPHFTPPELQSKKLRDASRTANHDRFGMAVLLFHLLFVGRHPFAGRFYGSGDLSIERAIAEGRFAFSRDKSTRCEPPPASLLLDDIPRALGELFEQAFRSQGDCDDRPSARQWVDSLDSLLRQRKQCSFDSAHVYYSGLAQCPWCRIEDEGGPAFFLQEGSATAIPQDRLDHLERKLQRIHFPVYPGLSPQQLKVPRLLAPKRSAARHKLSRVDMGAAAIILGFGLCLLSPLSWWALLAGTITAVAGAAALLALPDAKARRQTIDQQLKRLAGLQQHVERTARSIAETHRRGERAFEDSLEELKTERDHYHDPNAALPDVLAMHRMAERNRHLAHHLIPDHVASIRGMTSSTAAVLQSYGIESALDAEALKLLGIPMLTPGLTLELLTWREKVERAFTFKPALGIAIKPGEAANPVTVKRFKAVQAKRILMAVRQLESVANAARDQVGSELNRFDHAVSQVRNLIREIGESEGRRHPWEQKINRSPAAIILAAAAAPLAGLIARFLFG